MAIDEGFACLAATLAAFHGNEAGLLAVGTLGKMSLKTASNTTAGLFNKEPETPVAADHHESENKNIFS